MIRISHIDHVVLRVVNIDAMIGFYCVALGCAVERGNDDIGMVQLRAGSCLLDLVPVDGKLGSMGGAAPGVQGRNMDHLCFRIEHVDEPAIRSHLEACGVRAGAAELRYGAEGTGPSIYLADPEGNVIELKGPADGD